MGAQGDADVLSQLVLEAIAHVQAPGVYPPAALGAVINTLSANIGTFAEEMTKTNPLLAPMSLHLSVQHHLWVMYETGRRVQAHGLVMGKDD